MSGEIEQQLGNRKLWRVRTMVSFSGITLGLASCLTAYFFPFCHLLLLVNSIIWTFGPPSWFIIEYMFLFPKYGDPKDKDDLKYGQGLATKFWAGIGLLLTVIYQMQWRVCA